MQLRQEHQDPSQAAQVWLAEPGVVSSSSKIVEAGTPPTDTLQTANSGLRPALVLYICLSGSLEDTC